MKEKFYKVLSFTLALVLLLFAVLLTDSAMFSLEAHANEEFTEGYYTYTVTNGETTISYVDTSVSGNITIPSELGGYPVTTIGRWSFSCPSLTSVSIPDTVKTIEEGAFYGCYNLNELVFPRSVEIVKLDSFSLSVGYDIVFMNPACTIDNYPTTGGGDEMPRIVGFKGSTAEEYANRNNLEFKEYCEHSQQKNHDDSSATCTQPAYSEGIFCSDCNEWIKGHSIINKALGHKDSDIDGKCDICRTDFSEPKFTVEISDDENYYYIGIIMENAVGMEHATIILDTDETEFLDWNDWLKEGQDTIPVIPDGIKFFGGDKIPGKWSLYYGDGVLLSKEKYESAGFNFDPAKFQSNGYKLDKKQVKYDNEYTLPITAKIIIDGVEYVLEAPTFTISSSKFSESESAKILDNFLVMIPGIRVENLLLQAKKGAVIKDAKGNVIPSDAVTGTGMILSLPDNSEYPIAVYGDADGDGKISSADARFALRASVGLEDYNEDSAYYKAANVEKDDKLSAADARLLLRASVGLEKPEEWMK